MEQTMVAVETSGRIDERHRLELDAPLPITGPRRVRVIVLYTADDDWDETEWLRASAHNPAFDFLKDAAEDIYMPTDGVPFRDEV